MPFNYNDWVHIPFEERMNHIRDHVIMRLMDVRVKADETIRVLEANDLTPERELRRVYREARFYLKMAIKNWMGPQDVMIYTWIKTATEMEKKLETIINGWKEMLLQQAARQNEAAYQI